VVVCSEVSNRAVVDTPLMQNNEDVDMSGRETGGQGAWGWLC
jgi:hypothetical protein